MLTVPPEWDNGDRVASLVGTLADESHTSLHPRLKPRQDFQLLVNGEVAVMVLHDVIPASLQGRAFESWWPRVKEPVTNRPAVLGTKSLPKNMRRDGTPSEVKGVYDVIRRRTKAGEACQATLGWGKGGITPITEKRPEMMDDNRELIELVDNIFRKQLPQFREIARAALKAGPDGCRRWKTAFSSVYLFKNWSSRYHIDGNNMPGVLTGIAAFGSFDGGALVLPRFRLAVPYRPGDLCFFNPQILHGNLKITGKRISAAFYTAREIAA